MIKQVTEPLLAKYADILVNYALGSGKGINKGEVVYCVVPDLAKPMYGALQTAILKAGGQPMMRLAATGFNRQYYEMATQGQLTFFPKAYFRERTKLLDHFIGILAEQDLKELQGIDPQKIMMAAEATKPLRDWQNDKEYAGNFTWTVALYGTQAMAKAARLSLAEYWDQIIKACFLDFDKPVQKWREVNAEQQRVLSILNALPIETIHVEAEGINLWLKLGQSRKFIGGGGRNIPSFEIFTSPDWRGTQGSIAFNQPLYRYGHLVEGIELTFSQGKVIKAHAKRGNDLLLQMLKRPNADKVGEFSLTDARLSRITKFMANTLFDENMGDHFGNTHIALGMAYKDAYQGNPQLLTKPLAKKLGFNDSGEHTDIISTVNRQVTAIMQDSQEKVIYRDGRFTL